jgi:protein SCO1/2
MLFKRLDAAGDPLPMKPLSTLCLLIVCFPLFAASPGGDFELRAHDGSDWSTLQARGKVVVLVFGYTFCPDVCPTALATVAAAMRELGPDADRVQPLFVSLDPDRDTPEKLEPYVHWFHPSMIGLTGSPDELKQVAKRYQVQYEFVGKGEKEHYSLDHSANLYLLDAEGRLSGILPYGLPPDALVRAIRQALDGGSERPFAG